MNGDENRKIKRQMQKINCVRRQGKIEGQGQNCRVNGKQGDAVESEKVNSLHPK